ncbi:telomere length regulation protein tel2 homolog [Plakobranchus ocellatus]|uniref:Telomere length regulation protein tel2 homolog n=1 Tax=Plakobranchus ocellatus TaxID=259542 RepID=A0AAV3XY82_9GAST|nr:telomere length regulation protein tel2 homolog [Plakobranchus ocellatus]
MTGEIEIKPFIQELKTGLQTSNTEADIVKWLTVVKSLLAGPNTHVSHNIEKYGYSSRDMQRLYKNITDFHIKQIYDLILSKFSVEWISALGSENFKSLLKPIFMEGNVKESFIALFQASSESDRRDLRFHKCVALLEEFLTRLRLGKLLQSQSSCVSNQTSQTSCTLTLDPEQEVLMGFLTSLPDKMANKLHHDVRNCFLPQSFIPVLALGILDTLDWARQILAQGRNVSLHFVSVLIGKLSLVGYADILLETLLPHLCVRVRKDYMWCRICERIFSGVPARCQEALFVPLLRQIPWFGLVDKFLGDAVLHNTSVKMLLCTKLMLHRVISKPKTLLHNIIGYLSAFHTRRHLLVEVLLDLLRVWGDASSMRRISAEQHLYISRALMVCIGYLNETEKSANKNELLQLLMPGVQAHLESSDPAMRNVGMVVAKTLTQTVEPSGPKLEFELDVKNQDVSDLLSYTDIPEDPGILEAEESVMRSENESEAVEQGLASISIEKANSSGSPINEPELDSDDDLEPYDMSNDRKVEKAKKPKFIRDCMEGLICSSEDPDRTEVCLSEAEALIRKGTDGLDEVSEYLTREFYERNYSIRQRLDILETLASAAQELSCVKKQSVHVHTSNNELASGTSGFTSSSSSEMLPWQEVIQRRIESNTRRFAHGRTQPEPVPTLNRFAPVAGDFFYPLMYRVDQSDPCLDLMGRDNLLLFRLLYTLAIVLNSSKNIPACSKMGQALLEFTWPVRLHHDNCVRQAAVVATMTVLLVVPIHALISDLSVEVTETRTWLGDVVEQDPDTECQKLAAQALFLFQDRIKKESESATAS